MYGGAANVGTIFKLTPSNSSFKESVLWRFSGTNGANPAAGVTVDKAGHVYGTTCEGGSLGHGIVFEVTQ